MYGMTGRALPLTPISKKGWGMRVRHVEARGGKAPFAAFTDSLALKVC